MIITEIVRMKTVDEITRDEFIEIVDGLERNFHSMQEGFIDTQLLYHNEENEWYMIQHWKSDEDLKQAAKKIFIEKAAEDYVKSLDKQSIKMLVLPQIAAWTNTL